MDVAPAYVSDRSGVRIAYFATGQGHDAIILANGLGGRMYTWKPLVEALSEKYRVITWDYRGLFDSQCPKNRRYLSVHHQADDMRMVLDCEDIERAHVCGWSMGVQVSLEFAALYPERTQSLTLVNGTYGHAFAGALPLPYEWVHVIAEKLASARWVARAMSRVLPALAGPITRMFERLTGARQDLMRPILERYARDVFDEKNFANFVRLAQELDAQCAYHHLPDITAPALIISGGLDPLTPAKMARRMAKRMPHATHLHLPRGSHFVMLEQPHIVVPAVLEHLENHRAPFLVPKHVRRAPRLTARVSREAQACADARRSRPVERRASKK